MTRVCLAAVVLASVVLGLGARPASSDSCPASNPPNELVVAGGSSQTAKLRTAFDTPLQVQLANTNGCPVTGSLGGVSVHFQAPDGGASGVFSSTGSTSAFVGTNAQGVATAPAFVANGTAGSYAVEAESDDGSVDLYLSNTADGVAAAIGATSGAGQSATVDDGYASPLQAQVLDANGHPVQGVTVTFAIAVGPYGASATFAAGGGQATATTGSDGVATSPPLVANGSAGRFTATASTDGLSSVASYALDNHAALARVTWAGGPRATTVTRRFAAPLTARVLDASGQPIEGVDVTFALGGAEGGAGGAFLSGGVQAVVPTDANGVAVSPAVVANGVPGSYAATATIAGSATPATYALRNLAARIHAVQPRQSAAVGGRYPHALAARVTDASGRPVSGVTVTFALPQAAAGAAGATFAGGGATATATTDASGRASSPPLVAGSTAGAVTATASVAGGAPVGYRLVNRAAVADTVTAGAASGETTQPGSRFPVRMAVTVDDANGNPVGGAIVVFTAPAHGATGRFVAHGRRARVARATTDADGIAVAPPFVAGRTAGGYVVTASVRGASERAAFALLNERAG
jgi:protocatechuate 3,4-dioxygenase beta subunit